jgi:carbon-monoxide dehydrogenase medium subunit
MMTIGPDLLRPTSPQEAADAFGDGDGITVLAGGTTLVPQINAGWVRPDRTLLLDRAGLDGLSREGGVVRIGAACTLEALAAAPEPLASAARGIGDPEIRGQATIGGNLCMPRGSRYLGDLRAPLVALSASLRCATGSGERWAPVEAFGSGAISGWLVLDITFSEPRRAGYAALRRPHAHHDTILTVAAVETTAGLRVAASGTAAGTVRLHALEVSGDPADAAEGVEFADDPLASAAYRRRMLPILAAKAIAGN